jgi:hypothetical protein
VVISQACGFSLAGSRPALSRRGEGGLIGFLGKVEIAEEADQGGEDPPHSRRKTPVRVNGLPSPWRNEFATTGIWSALSSGAPPRRGRGQRVQRRWGASPGVGAR